MFEETLVTCNSLSMSSTVFYRLMCSSTDFRKVMPKYHPLGPGKDSQLAGSVDHNYPGLFSQCYRCMIAKLVNITPISTLW